VTIKGNFTQMIGDNSVGHLGLAFIRVALSVGYFSWRPNEQNVEIIIALGMIRINETNY
jgi:hypothetical protein